MSEESPKPAEVPADESAAATEHGPTEWSVVRTGGPMKYADMVGLPKVLADIREFAKQDPLFWQPSPLLVDLVERGASFDSLNHA